MYALIFEDPVTHETVNTYDDWKLAPTARPVFSPPAQKTHFVDIPSANGQIDLSEALTGYPLYENREDSLTFFVLNELNEVDRSTERWYDLYSRIMKTIHGKEMRVYLSEDPGFFYVGRFEVDKWSSKKDNSEITIKYNLDPYKYHLTTSTDDWLWDPFDFVNGYIDVADFKNVVINSSDFVELNIVDPDKSFDTAPVVPTITASNVQATMYMRFVNPQMRVDVTYPLKAGKNIFYDCVMVKNQFHIYFKGRGTVSVDFRNGRL